MRASRTGRQWKLLTPKTLKKAREAKNWSRKDLADSLGVSQGAIQGWESGSGTPPDDTQIKLCKLLELPQEPPSNGGAQAAAPRRKAPAAVEQEAQQANQRDYAVASIVAAMVHKGLLNTKESVLSAIPEVTKAL